VKQLYVKKYNSFLITGTFKLTSLHARNTEKYRRLQKAVDRRRQEEVVKGRRKPEKETELGNRQKAGCGCYITCP
jgi:nitroimidazol reductase NimA-like FMN-containing flavoprotein (pyridoxamine 5'-phosphate oxidase superfamily)